eukprot:511184_1
MTTQIISNANNTQKLNSKLPPPPLPKHIRDKSSQYTITHSYGSFNDNLNKNNITLSNTKSICSNSPLPLTESSIDSTPSYTITSSLSTELTSHEHYISINDKIHNNITMQSSTNCNSTSNQNNCNNNNKQNNNDQNENNENENNENDNNNGSNSTGGSGNGGSGNGGKKHNNNDDDKNKKNEDKEEDKDDEKQVKLVKKRFSELTPCLCLDGAQKTVSLTEYPFRYTPIGLERVVGRIKISKEITQITIPNIIRENITNIYFFIDQMIAIAIYDKQYYDNGQIRIFNPGFHDESGHSLYCVVEKIDTPRNIRLSYEMKNKLFTTKNLLNEFCKYNLHEHDLPVNTSDMIVSMVNVEKMKNKLADHAPFCMNIIFKTKWHRQHVFGRKNNKQRHTFSIVKNEFISIVQEQIYTQKCPVVIPIIMFHSSGYRIEYIHIVKLKENISIGISYIDNKHCKYGIKVTGIHLDKNNMISNHQLLFPC